MTEEEIRTQLRPEVEALAEKYGVDFEAAMSMLKRKYDGYHFTKNSEELYNPFSLLKAFQQRELVNYWFESGTPTFLIRQMQHFNTDITSMERIEVPASAFDQPTENMIDTLPLLYQSGYLTIKDYDSEGEYYTLSFPNTEVRIGYVKGLLPTYVGLKDSEVQMGFALKFWRALKKGDIELAMSEMKAYMAGIPYIEGFKKKLAESANAEGFYEYTMYLIFSMLNLYARTQVRCASGRADMVVWMPDTIYVFELKREGTARQALEQIDTKGYSIPYQTDNRKVVKVGVKFNADTRVPEEWVINM